MRAIGFTILIILVILFDTSCKKHKLTGDQRSRLTGKWEWYSTRERFLGNPGYSIFYTPITEGKTHELVFHDKGKVEYYENGNLIDCYRLVFVAESNSLEFTNGFYFSIYLNNKENKVLSLTVYGNNSDSLMTRQFPYSEEESEYNPAPLYYNYFVKVE